LSQTKRRALHFDFSCEFAVYLVAIPKCRADEDLDLSLGTFKNNAAMGNFTGILRTNTFLKVEVCVRAAALLFNCKN